MTSISDFKYKMLEKKLFEEGIYNVNQYVEEVYLDALENDITAINVAKDSNDLISNGHRETGRTLFGYKEYLRSKKYDLGEILINQHLCAERKFIPDLFIPKIKLDIDYDGTSGHGTQEDDKKDMEKDIEIKKRGNIPWRIRARSIGPLETADCLLVKDNQLLISDQRNFVRKLNDFLKFWYFDEKFIVDYINKHPLYHKGTFLFEHEKYRLAEITLNGYLRNNRISANRGHIAAI